MPSNDVITLDGVSKTYRLGHIRVPALADVTLTIAAGDFIALAGPSGSGKTTLLNLIGCIDKPDGGRIVVDDVDVTPIPLHRLASLRRDTLGFIFQTFNLIPVLTAYENVELPLIYAKIPRTERRDMAEEALSAVGLKDRMSHQPNELSGGQRQRVAIARALVNKPSLLLADEPTGNLDSQTGREILDLFRDLHSRGNSIIMVTHEDDVAKEAARVIHLRDGKIQD